ncbi:MAG: terminase [Dehalococcoidia bacterium]
MDYAQHIGEGFGPAWRGIIFRQTYKQLEDLITKSKRWYYQIWPGCTFNAANHTWTFPDGAQLLLRQYNRDDDYLNYHGHEFPFVGWDELTNWANLDGYKRMMSVCRSSTPGMPRNVRATTNPYGPGHTAVKFHFRLPEMDGQIRRRPFEIENPLTGEVTTQTLTRLAVKGTIFENTILLNAQPAYIAQLKEAARNPEELKAWLEGDWDIVAGGMFADVWEPRHNVVPQFMVPRSWRVDRSFDWGSSAPFSVGWWAESDGSDLKFPDGRVKSTVRGDLFRIHEWYGWSGQPNQGIRMLAVDIAEGIVQREMQWGLRAGSGATEQITVRPGPADNSIHDVENGVSIGMDMSKPIRVGNEMHKGIAWDRADKRPGSRKNGWEHMRKMMKNAHPTPGRPREHPGLFVTAECDQFLRTVPSLARSEKDMDDVNTASEDHIGDETRYRVRFSGQRAVSGTHIGMY